MKNKAMFSGWKELGGDDPNIGEFRFEYNGVAWGVYKRQRGPLGGYSFVHCGTLRQINRESNKALHARAVEEFGRVR